MQTHRRLGQASTLDIRWRHARLSLQPVAPLRPCTGRQGCRVRETSVFFSVYPAHVVRPPWWLHDDDDDDDDDDDGDDGDDADDDAADDDDDDDDDSRIDSRMIFYFCE